MFRHLDIRLGGLEIVLVPAAGHDRDVVGVVLGDDAPGEEGRHPQLVLESAHWLLSLTAHVDISYLSIAVFLNCISAPEYLLLKVDARVGSSGDVPSSRKLNYRLDTARRQSFNYQQIK